MKELEDAGPVQPSRTHMLMANDSGSADDDADPTSYHTQIHTE